MQNITILKKNKNMVTRKIADETILLPIYRTSKEINCIYTLNKPASIVWDMIDGKTTVAKIKDNILNNGFDTTEEDMNEWLKTFLKELKEIKAVIKDKGKKIKVKGKGEGKRIKIKKDNVGAGLASARNKKKGRKMKFRPEITRVKLNPEQAVLSCSCYTGQRLNRFCGWSSFAAWEDITLGGGDVCVSKFTYSIDKDAYPGYCGFCAGESSPSS